MLYRARQPALDRDVVVRVLSAPAAAAPPAHPHLAGVYGSGRTARGELYVLLPYLPGGSLADRARAAGSFAPAEAAALGIKLAGALAAVHRAGTVHGRVTARNVLWSAYGEPQLTDCCAGPPENGPHAAPEVPAGGPATPASDVYALSRLLLDAAGPRPDRRLSAALAPALAADPAARPPAEALGRRLRELVPADAPRPDRRETARRRRPAAAVVLACALAAAVALVLRAAGADDASPAEIEALTDTRSKRCAAASSQPRGGGVEITAPAAGATVARTVTMGGTADPAAGPVHLFVYSPGICLYYFHGEWTAAVDPGGRWAATIDTGMARGSQEELWAVQVEVSGRALLAGVLERFERRIDDDPYVAVLPEGAHGARVAVSVG